METYERTHQHGPAPMTRVRVRLQTLPCPGKSFTGLHIGRLAIPLVLVLIMMCGMFLSAVRESEALPGFARKYNADCSMCHFPVIPRLNNFGQMYRRMGYRTKIEINKDQDLTKVNEMLSGRIKSQFSYDNTQGQIERTQFTFPDLSLFYAGAVSRNFSAWIHAFASNSTSLDFHGHIMGNFGSAENMFMFRVGQMHMLQQEGVGGFDRPTSININPVHLLALTRANVVATGAAAPTGGSTYTFDLRQKGIELAYMHGPGKLGVMISNGLNETGSGVSSVGDIDPQKDYMVFYEHLLDDIASGFTLFYYNGTTHSSTSTTAPRPEFNFNRFGFNVTKVFPVADLGFIELQGGYVRSHDNNPATPVTATTPITPLSVTGNSFYIESQQYLTGYEITFYERYSAINLNGAQPNGIRKDYTAGFVKPLQTWVRLSGDYTYTYNPFGGTGQVLLFELQINY